MPLHSIRDFTVYMLRKKHREISNFLKYAMGMH